MRKTRIWAMLLMAASSQGQSQKPLSDLQKCQTMQKACMAIGLKHEAKIDDLQKQNDQWQAWYNKNWIPLEAENERLNAEIAAKTDLGWIIFLAFVGTGAGCLAMWSIVKAIRRWWPVSKQRRQLITLLLVATWVTVASVVALWNSNLNNHPINLVATVFAHSLPALAFGGVGVWWFGRTKPEVLW